MVIQRWQSVMLLIAGVMMGLFSFLSLGQIQTVDYTFNVNALGICREGIATAPDEVMGISTIIPFVVGLLSCVLPIIGIFCYQHMRLQKRVCLISALLTVAAAVICAYCAIDFAAGYQAMPSWGSAACTPFIALIADLTAWRLIENDQKKLRAADRLR